MPTMTKPEAIAFYEARMRGWVHNDGLSICAQAEEIFTDSMEGSYRSAWRSLQRKYPGTKTYEVKTNKGWITTKGIDYKSVEDAFLAWRDKNPNHEFNP